MVRGAVAYLDFDIMLLAQCTGLLVDLLNGLMDGESVLGWWGSRCWVVGLSVLAGKVVGAGWWAPGGGQSVAGG